MSAKALGFELQEPTVVTVGMQVTGNLVSQGDIRIEGRVEGDVHGHRVAVPVGGSVAGSVFAEAVIVEGVVRGQVRAKRVRLMPSAEVAMDVTYHEIIVDSGARLNGSMFPRPADEWDADAPAGTIAPPKVPELKSGPPAATSPVSDISADETAPAPENTVAIPLGSGGRIYTRKESSALPKFTPVPREPEVARPRRGGFGLAALFAAVVVVGAAGAGLGLTGFGKNEDKVSAARIAAEVEAAAKIRAIEAEARRKAEEDAQRAAEAVAEARAQAEQAARKAAAAQARRAAEETARIAAKKAADARRKVEEKARQEAAKKEAEKRKAEKAAAEARRKVDELSHQAAVAELRRKLAVETGPQVDENAGALADANTRRDSDPEPGQQEPAQQEPAQQAPVRRPSAQQAAVQPEPPTAGQAIDEFKAGVAAFRRNDFDEAIARLSPAIESGKLSNAELAAAYRRRAESFAGKKQFKRAIADYTETIRLTPGDPVAYNNRGYAFNRLGQGAKALADASRAIEINPGYAHAYSNRCWAYQKLRQRDKAIADCRRALSLNPRLAFARKSLRRMGIEP